MLAIQGGKTVTLSLLGGRLRPVACDGRGRRSDCRLFCAAVIAASFTVGCQAALAQTQPSPAVASSEGATLEEVTVTGSRIVRDGMESPTPVTVVGTAR